MYDQVPETLTVNKLIILEAEGYKDQFIRPYEMSVTYNDMANLEKVVSSRARVNNRIITATHDPSQTLGISAAELSSSMANIYMPADVPTTLSPIINGWNERRGKFMLEIEQPSVTGYGSTIYHIQGYTSHWGVSNSGHIDENMMFFINTITIFHRTVAADNRVLTRVTDKFSLLGNEGSTFMNVSHTLPQDDLVLNRPEDITGMLVTKQLNSDSEYADINVSYETSGQYRNANKSDSSIELVNRSYHTPASHIASIVDETYAGSNTHNTTSFTKGVDTLDQATIHLSKHNIYDILFMNKLIALNGGRDVSCFTTETLKLMTADIDSDVVQIIQLDRKALPLGSNEGTADLNTSHRETKLAILAVESISAMMTEHMISSANIFITNDSGNYQVSILEPFMMLEGLDSVAWVNSLRTAIVRELMPTLTYNNKLLIDMTINISIISDAYVTISIDKQAPMPYVLPLFTDSLISPVISNSATFDNNVENYKKLTDTIIASGI